MEATECQTIATLLELADRMQASAVAGDWDAVTRFRDECQRCVERMIAGYAGSSDVAAMGDVIRRVSSVNDNVINLCRAARDAQGRELEALRQGRRAVSRYSSNAD